MFKGIPKLQLIVLGIGILLLAAGLIWMLADMILPPRIPIVDPVNLVQEVMSYVS